MFLHEIWWLYLLQWINLIRKQTLSRDIWLTRDSLTKLNHGAGKHQISNTNILNKVAIFCKLFVCSGISSMLNLGYLKIHIILLFFLCGGVEVNRQPTSKQHFVTDMYYHQYNRQIILIPIYIFTYRDKTKRHKIAIFLLAPITFCNFLSLILVFNIVSKEEH